MADSRAICILSPPRSGSSLTARIISILGVHLGTERDFVEPSRNNPTGYWECQSIKEINEEILSRLGYGTSRAGADWIEPPTFPDNWEMSPKLSDLRGRAENLVKRKYGKYDVWGWKDPRTCLTLPFWKRILPRIDYVILIRNPVDVGRSVERFIKTGCSFERGLFIWALYLNFAFKHTSGENRILVNVEGWTEDWERELSRLARFLGNHGLSDNAGVRTAVHEFVDANLWHHRSSSLALQTVQRLYGELRAHDEGGVQDSFFSGQETLEVLASEALRCDADTRKREQNQWNRRLSAAIDELGHVVPRDTNLVLVEENQIGTDVFEGRNVTPFLQRNGEYFGIPANSEEAIAEFNRLHAAGAHYLAFAWPAHWWLDYFSEFNDYLRLKFRCILQNERMIVFDLN